MSWAAKRICTTHCAAASKYSLGIFSQHAWFLLFTVAWCSSIYVSEVNTVLLTLSLGVFKHLHISEIMSTNGIHPFYMHVKESEQPFEWHVHTPILIRCVITILRGLLPLSRLAMGMELSCMLLCETHSSHVRKAAIASNLLTLVIKVRLKCRGQPGNGPCQTQLVLVGNMILV